MSRPFQPPLLVAHAHDVGDKHVVVDLGVAGPGRRMAGHRPGEPFGRGADLGAAATAASVHDDLVEVGHGGVPLGVDDLVHVLGPADHAQLCHRLVRTDDDLHARPHAADQALAAERVVSPAGGEDGSPLVQVHFAVQAQPRRAGAAPAPWASHPGTRSTSSAPATGSSPRPATVCSW